ncbi:2-methylisocitrate lyase-like PEP mutase family enzyme [Bradyrhizobium sp. USDA 3311]
MQDQSGQTVAAGGSVSRMACTLTKMLRAQICCSNELSFLMEAHDGLSAAMAELTGFKGLWASGLSIACALGSRNVNEASRSQLVDIVERRVRC